MLLYAQNMPQYAVPNMQEICSNMQKRNTQYMCIVSLNMLNIQNKNMLTISSCMPQYHSINMHTQNAQNMQICTNIHFQNMHNHAFYM